MFYAVSDKRQYDYTAVRVAHVVRVKFTPGFVKD